ncbi:MAG: hypothetical protein GXY83_12080 [Rhodopirellula sp.]|nr:hypothetical protein [Rhodopirellula sp.]
MSRLYSMTVYVEDFQAAHTADIQKAANDEWSGLELRSNPVEGNVLSGEAESQLCGGETEEEFALRISKAIFQANQGPCIVRVDAIYLEELPYETYEHGPEDYDRVMNSVSVFDS